VSVRDAEPGPAPAPAWASAEAAARRSYGRLVAFLAARSGDVAGAQDALSAAFERALKTWPKAGVPQCPEAWLLTVARRVQIDASRRRRSHAQALLVLEQMAPEPGPCASTAGFDAEPAVPIPDERLALMFACAHPAIDPGVHAPLILQTVLGFDAGTIAAAFLTSPAALSQRLVRAKSKIKLARIPFEIPDLADIEPRLGSVLAAVYAIYSTGWSEPPGDDAQGCKPALEALWLGRLLAQLAPDQPEVLGLLALMLHAQARCGARRTHEGAYVPLDEQAPRDWDAEMIDEAEALLLRAAAFARPGRYQLEAAVQSAHAQRRHSGCTDWKAIVALYDQLLDCTGSPVVALNRAVAVARARGPAEGLVLLESLADDGRLRDYQPYWAARADLLAGCGQIAEAGRAYLRSVELETDPAVRAFLRARACALASQAAK
jgi:RNA polymerase sigma-70 factor (ECF subfamily)